MEIIINPIILFFSAIAIYLTGVCYFYKKVKLAILFSILFYGLNIYMSGEIFYRDHLVVFCVLTTFTFLIPLFCLITFAFDVKYALFCIDTSFLVPLVWLIGPIILPVNALFYFIIKV